MCQGVRSAGGNWSIGRHRLVSRQESIGSFARLQRRRAASLPKQPHRTAGDGENRQHQAGDDSKAAPQRAKPLAEMQVVRPAQRQFGEPAWRAGPAPTATRESVGIDRDGDRRGRAVRVGRHQQDADRIGTSTAGSSTARTRKPVRRALATAIARSTSTAGAATRRSGRRGPASARPSAPRIVCGNASTTPVDGRCQQQREAPDAERMPCSRRWNA